MNELSRSKVLGAGGSIGFHVCKLCLNRGAVEMFGRVLNKRLLVIPDAVRRLRDSGEVDRLPASNQAARDDRNDLYHV